GDVRAAVLSKNGVWLAYGGGSSGVHARNLRSGESILIDLPDKSGEPGTWTPVAWFPDHARFLLNHVTRTNSSVWSVSIGGDLPVRISDAASAYAISDAGDRVALAPTGPNAARELWIADARGQGLRKRLALEEGERFQRVHWAGDRIFFLRQGRTAEE